MNRLAPYAAFFMRLAVGGVFLQHGLNKLDRGFPATAAFLSSHGFPFADFWAVVLIAIETVGAACVILGVVTRLWGAAMAVVMAIAMAVVRIPSGANLELEALLFAGAVTLVALGDGPLSIAVKFKKT